MPFITAPTLLAHAGHTHAAAGESNVAALVFAGLPFLVAAVITHFRGGTVSTVVLFSAAAGFVHAVVTPEHFQEDLAVGLFILAVAVGQMAVVVAGLNRPARRLWPATAVGNAAVLGIWAWSRTTGLPFGPNPGMPEPVGLLDLACAAYEVAIIAASLTLAGRTGLIPRQSASRSTAPISPAAAMANLSS